MDYRKYVNTKKYPRKEKYTTYKVVTLNETYENLNHEEFEKRKKSLREKNVNFLVDTTVSDGYEKELKEYTDESNCLDALFKQDLKDDVADFGDDVIFEIVYSKAWEDGHSGGLDDIYNKFLDLSDLVEDVLKHVAQK